MRTRSVLIVTIVLAIAGCGGGATGEPLISGSVTGVYAGASYTVAYGFLGKSAAGDSLIALGTDAINCDSLTAADPPPGDTAAISVPMVSVGTYNNVGVQLFHNIDAFNGVGSNLGALGISLTSPESVSGSIAYTDTIDGQAYSLNGSFEVVTCP